MATAAHVAFRAGGEHERLLCRNWWLVLLRGIAALIFGVLAILWPGATLLTLVILVSAYFIVDGIFTIAAAARTAQQHERWWPFLLEGIIDIAAGVVIFLWPGPSALALMYLLAIWAIFTGVAMVIGGSALGTGSPRWLLLLSGALSVLLGVVMIAQPELGLLALAWWVGTYALVFGILLVWLAVILRSRGRVIPVVPV